MTGLRILFIMIGAVSFTVQASDFGNSILKVRSTVAPTASPTPEPSSSPSPPPPLSHSNVPIDCMESAMDLGLTIEQGILLCTNSTTLDPIHCFKKTCSYLTNDQKISLCSGATSDAPVRCFEETSDLALTFDQRTKLCNEASYVNSAISNPNAWTTAPAHCFKDGFKLPLTQDQRVILCTSAVSDDPVRCFIRADHFGLTFDQRVRLCTQLSPSSW